jgi:hypothetical protein
VALEHVTEGRTTSSTTAFDRPAASVIVVSDYGSWNEDGWNDLRGTLRIVADQSADTGAEVFLIDSRPAGQTMPDDVPALVPGMRIIGPSSKTAQELLNEAVHAARSDVVVLLDGDCTPSPGWLRAAIAAMRRWPDAAAVSGRTVYPDTSFAFRVLGLLSRSYLDPGRPGPTRFVSNYNAALRRDALLAHPLASMRRAMAARLQTEAIRIGGGGLYFEPAMRVTHRFEGWEMERRIRHNVGYRTVRVRVLEPRIPHAWMLRLGPLALPALIAARTADSWWDCLRVGRHYGVRWFEMPSALAIAVYVHLLEVGGMSTALAEARDARVDSRSLTQTDETA